MREIVADLDHLAREYSRRARQNVKTRVTRLVQLDREPEDVVIVAGSARSGTTWLAELIDWDGSFRYSFEPLHPATKDFQHFRAHQYVPIDCVDPTLTNPLTAMMHGKVFAPYPDSWDPHFSFRPRSHLLIKFVRANLMLGWLLERFPATRVVFIVRDPRDVISSRRRLDWTDDLAELVAQPDLVADHVAPYLDLIDEVTDPAERDLICWCVENAVALGDLCQREQAHIIRYEDLASRPDIVLPAVFDHIGRPWDPAVLDTVTKPSRSPKVCDGDAFEPIGLDTPTVQRLTGQFGLAHLLEPPAVSR